MKDLKTKTLRGGLARIFAQAANFLLRLLAIMALARLLDPKDFGLVGMVTAFTGVLNLFRDFGLSAAAIQSEDVTDEQLSNLFWINIWVGALLAIITFAFAPAIATFYHEPRLFGVTAVLAIGFFFNAAGVQHGAILQRQLRFTTMSVVNTVALLLSTAIGIGGAAMGYGYWSLVAMTVAAPLVNTIGFCLTTSWIPAMPRRLAGVRSMMRFGGAVTLNSLLGYTATNLEKVLIGKSWGADAIGIYGRAFQLSNVAADNLNSTAGEVAFAALSRLQNEPLRLKRYFLKGYSLILALTLPLTLACALFAPDIVFTFLGPKWREAVPIFRLLAPTILAFAMANPLSWLLYSIGKIGRLVRMSLVFTPLMIAGYFVALPYGPKGVALAYSILMTLWIFPLIAWAVRGTMISFADMMHTVKWPLASSIVAGAAAYGVRFLCLPYLPTLPRLILEGFVMLAVYAGMLLFVTGEKAFYLDVLRGLKGSPSAKEDELVSA
ncbi:MAG TPA: lipopolysaccharide biosynthesis protein [Candidatus Dormibacteraeota bacterium]|jgi:O-antigen/teichoic acid export membrane protein|nr:lipopolysaccharide biosynthesis protein [Candidatus Dormibacteraeota bacterium]